MMTPLNVTSDDQATALAPARPLPFAEDEAGFAYFGSDYHHRFLAAAVLRQLVEGRSLVLIGGEPAADGELLERFINEAGEQRHRASLVRCRPGMDYAAVIRAYNRQLGLRQEADGAGIWTLLSHLMVEARNGVTRVLILEHAEMLEGGSFDELLRFTALDEPHVMPVLLLVSAGFAETADAPQLALLQSPVAARIPVDRLAPEEVDAFIRYQLNASAEDDSGFFPPDTVRAIAAAAEGSAVAVNRLARQVWEAAGGTGLSRPPVQPAPPAVRAVAVVDVSARTVATGEPPVQRRRRLPAAVTAGLYVAAVSLSGLALLHVLMPHAPQPATAPAAVMSLPTEQPAWSSGDVAMPPPVAPPDVAAASAASSENAPQQPRPPADAAAVAAPPSSPPERQPPAMPSSPEAPAAASPPPVEAPVAAAAAASPPPEAPAPASPPPPEAPAAAAPASPPPPEAPAAAAPASPPPEQQAEVPPPSETRAAPPASVAAPAPAPPVTPPDAETALMVRRGEQLLAVGDIVPARHFFERAAASGDAAALYGLGKSYDPLFLRQIRAVGLAGDTTMAVVWYRRAAAAGSDEARMRLEGLGAQASGGGR